MAAAISAIETGGGGGDLPEEAYTITGDCSYKFAYGGWDWYIEALGDKATTKDITKCQYMFHSTKVAEIPFDINCIPSTEVDMGNLFSSCNNLESIPKINNCKPKELTCIFKDCRRLREIPEDIESWFDWSYIDNLSTGSYGSRDSTFNSCYSLRKIPTSFLAHGNKATPYYYSIYSGAFVNCYALDEILNIPFPHLNVTWTSNNFSNTFNSCYRVKNITFALNNGAPYVVNWKGQTIDLSNNIGLTTTNGNIINYNSGITADKEVKDDATYQALKNDPDWFTKSIKYSRYNHDSAVATINTLPDTSAYLATQSSGTNTIKFKGEAGSKTDGGAINTLTEEEIAVATAKGWTVTLS